MITNENDLTELLTLKKIDNDLYEGPMNKLPWRRVFGGQVVAQALIGATETVGQNRLVHSLHAYFMRPGDPSTPIHYQVHRDRDGGTFCSRRVVALQNNLPILNLACSFQIQEGGFSHQIEMPKIEKPDDSINFETYLNNMGNQIDDQTRGILAKLGSAEFRKLSSKPNQDTQNYWFRVNNNPTQNQNIQRALLAYASDFTFLGASLAPHSKNLFDDDIQVASLDHAIWFHENVDISQWHLYNQDSPWAGGGRGLNRGNIFDENGKLIASVAQEALIRMRK